MIGALVLTCALGLLSPPEEDGTAGAKLDQIWQKVMQQSNSSGEFLAPGLMNGGVADFLKKDYLWQTQNTLSDELPKGHKKFIHPVGVVGKVHFEWNENARGYTGLFEKADHCLVRFSSAAKPYTGGNGLMPGMGLKCLRDNTDSGNFVAMWQLDGITDKISVKSLDDALAATPQRVETYGGGNSGAVRIVMAKPKQDPKKTCKFFSVPFSNHVPARKNLPSKIGVLAHLTFRKVSLPPMKHSRAWDMTWWKKSTWNFGSSGWLGAAGLVGLSQFADSSQNGERVLEPNFPFALVFRPAEVAKLECTRTEDGLDQVRRIKQGMSIYDVYAIRDPTKDPAATDIVHIGTLKADSDFHTSKYGDGKLFFRHDFFGKDVAELGRQCDQFRKTEVCYRKHDWEKIWIDNTFMEDEGAAKYVSVLDKEAAPAAFFEEAKSAGAEKVAAVVRHQNAS